MKVLYFIAGLSPTPEELKAANAMGAVLRSACSYHEGDFIEKCDAVAGCYPESYAHLFKKQPKDAGETQPKTEKVKAESKK